MPWFVSVGDSRLSLDAHAYASLIGDLRAASEPLILYASADPDWRKPASGMLLAACDWYAVAPSEATYVGDMDTDAAAAAAAGTAFVFAEVFFGTSGDSEG